MPNFLAIPANLSAAAGHGECSRQHEDQQPRAAKGESDQQRPVDATQES